MSSAASYLALDLGAESGRAVLGRFDGERMQMEPVHRFPNRPVNLPDGAHWDALRIFTALAEARNRERLVRPATPGFMPALAARFADVHAGQRR